jgi:hypothetical protein
LDENGPGAFGCVSMFLMFRVLRSAALSLALRLPTMSFVYPRGFSLALRILRSRAEPERGVVGCVSMFLMFRVLRSAALSLALRLPTMSFVYPRGFSLALRILRSRAEPERGVDLFLTFVLFRRDLD